MWYDYILGLACIVSIVRLALLLTNNKSYENKVGKVGAWFFGLALFVISWGVIKSIFPKVDMGNKLKGKNTHIQQQTQENKDKENSIPILIK